MCTFNIIHVVNIRYSYRRKRLFYIETISYGYHIILFHDYLSTCDCLKFTECPKSFWQNMQIHFRFIFQQQLYLPIFISKFKIVLLTIIKLNKIGHILNLICLNLSVLIILINVYPINCSILLSLIKCVWNSVLTLKLCNQHRQR